MPFATQSLRKSAEEHEQVNLDALSTSATLWSRICLRVLGFSSSFSILAMMLSASSRCCLALTWPS